MGHLAFGMDALIGSPASMDLDGFARQAMEHFLDSLLHGHVVRLHLPARIGAAIIGHRDAITEGG